VIFEQNMEAGIGTLRYLAEIYPQDANGRRFLVLLYQATGDMDQTIAEARALLAIDSVDVQSTRILAGAFQERQDFDSALVYYQRLADRLPADIQTRLDIAATRVRLGQFDQARNELERAIIAAPDDPDPHNWIARLDIREGRYQEATERTQRVTELARTPQERATAAGLEETLYYNRGQFYRLEDAYQRRLAALSEYASPLQVLFLAEASELLRWATRAGHETYALQQIDSLQNLVEAPFNRILESAAVRIHLELGDVEAAGASLSSLRESDLPTGSTIGGEAFMIWIEGRIAEIEDGNCSGALDSYDRASDQQSLSPLYRSSRLGCLTSLERWSEANTEAEWLLEHFPGTGLLRLTVARYHAARGQTSEAIGHLQAALGFWSEADAEFIPAQQARALLSELQGA
jgi:tetratricopeptide (TPR) repeat protein